MRRRSPTIFDPFFTTKAKGTEPGWGCPPSTEYIQQSRGASLCIAKWDVAPVKIYLPRAFEAAVQTESTVPAAGLFPAGPKQFWWSRMRTPVRTLISAVLKRQGYTVLRAEPGADRKHYTFLGNTTAAST